ncbi:MAG TPA: hypothetical protein VF832_12130, partial [Longimicrobiales bacterium]
TGVFSASASSADGVAGNNDGSLANARVTTVVGPIAVAVVGPATPAPQLPGTGYTLTFKVRNTGAGQEQIELASSLVQTGAILRLRSIAGTGLTVVDSADARITLAAGDSVAVTVRYDVLMGDSAQATLRLDGEVSGVPSSEQIASVVITREVPRLNVSHSVTPSGTVLPGSALTYTIQVVSTGQQPAQSVRVSEAVSSRVAIQVGSPAVTLPGGVTALVTYFDAGGSYTPMSGGCGAPAGYDGCVVAIQWTLTGGVAVGASATMTYAAKVK